MLWNVLFWTKHTCSTNELTAAVATCPRPVLDLVHQNSTMDGSGDHKIPPLSGELRTVKDLWGRGIIPHSSKETLPMLCRQNPTKHMYYKRIYR